MNFSVFIKEKLFYVQLAILFALSVVFAYERILNVDNSLAFFNIVNSKIFNFPEFRVGVVFTQIPLMLGALLHLPLKMLVYLYSITFPLLYIFIFFICYHLLKNTEAAICLLLSLCICTAQSFFHPVTETHQAIAFSCLLYAVISSGQISNTIIKYLLTCCIIILCLLTHPVALFTVLFVLIFSFINHSGQKDRVFYFSAVIVTFLFSLIRFLASTKGYDAEQYEQLKNFKNILPVFFSLYPVLFIKIHFIELYLSATILFLLSECYFLYSKKIIHALLLAVSVIGFVCISIITFNKGDADMMMEKSFMPAAFMICLCFTYIITLVNFKSYMHNISYIFIHFILIISFIRIIPGGKIFTTRINYLDRIITYAEMIKSPKLIFNPSNLNKDILINNWGFSLDLLILSACDKKQITTAYIADDKELRHFQLGDKYLFLWWPVLDQRALDTAYFNLQTTPYVIVNKFLKL